MNSLYLFFPTIELEVSAKEFINEFIEYESELNGGAGLRRYLNDYNAWLVKINHDKNQKDKVPATTYFAIREDDKKLLEY